MTESRYGWRAWGLGIAFLGVVSLVLGDFDPGQPVPAAFPGRHLLALVADGLMIVTGLLLQWRRATAWAAVTLTGYYLVFVVILMTGRIVLLHPALYGAYESLAEQVALTAAGLIICAQTTLVQSLRAATVMHVGQAAFGVCAIVFGGAHFVYMNLTAPLVPTWLPPSQQFWGYATGWFHIAAGVAILARWHARLAAILLTIMFASFTPLVHLPLLLGAPRTPFFWTENALNIALVGAAWVVAESFEVTGEVRPLTSAR